MSLPAGSAKADNGALFMLRTRAELSTWSDTELADRLRYVKAYTDPETAGVAFMRSWVRNVANSERRALLFEMSRRARATDTR